MVRISNKEIPSNKNVPIGLTSIYGIGRTTAEQIVKNCGINFHTKVKELNENQIKDISQEIKKYTVEENLKEQVSKIIDNQIKLGTYHGLRRERKLPIRGQRTRHNARTAKGHKRLTVANKKKAPTPNVKLQVRGIGSARNPVIEKILEAKSLKVEEIIDATPIPHGGCRPQIINKNNPYSSAFVFHHLLPSMGVTLGNSLRRFLLDYTTGIAIWGVEISDKNGSIRTKLESLEGVDKVTPYLIMKLKEIIFEEKESKKENFILEMDIENKEKKDRIIRAGDFQKINGLEIKNPELELATLSYRQADQQREEIKVEEENIIILDTNYSPIKGGQVNFQVDPVITDLDQKKEEKLILTFNTNGCVKPKKVLQEALEVALNSFSHISKLIDEKKRTKASKVLNNLVADTILYEKIETSLPMAKSLTKLLAKLVGYAKQDTLHSRRMALRYLVNKKHSGVVSKLFTELKNRYQSREGGYSRITKLELRRGDATLMVVFSLV
ncbi:12450_t:CDS:2 [Funneliformis geosporum]|uniref:12450_t:CDS:1 n=1 Tax=Funneliformis geosporum TaxID=1117311 RepID=A0A9W4SA03_9GLOM|nr:12450_t:CDS:2 [Funneliformis geosporum]